jgi:hypothetical protein
MNRLDYLFLTAAAVLAVLVGRGARELTPRAAPPRAAPEDLVGPVSVGTQTTLVSGDGSVGLEAVSAGGPREPRSRPLDAGEVRRRLRVGQAGTYIGELLIDHDSSLARWPDRTRSPLRVWVQPSSSVRHWRPEFVKHVREAFTAWEGVGIPVRFTFVVDSARADVHVAWIDHFDEPISGKTLWARDARWWIVDGNITIAVHHNEGDPLDAGAVRAIALHEVGHLLGLDHTADTSNIMTPKVRVREISPADRATARLLYTLPPGAVR